MDIEYTNFDLRNDPSYIFSVTCLSEVLTFFVTWNSRKSKRSIYVQNSSGECILQNTYINPSEALEFNFNAKNRGYYCKLLLCPKDSDFKSLDMLNWADNYFLSVYRLVQEPVI